MKKHLVLPLAVGTVFALALVAFAQPGGTAGGTRGGGGNFQARREAQTKAIETLEQAVAKLKATMTAPGQRGNAQEMSEEERANRREQMTQRRQEQQDAIATIESQVVMLKARRQLQTEHEEALAQLQAVETQAKSENAPKTAALIAKMIQDKQAKYDELMAKLGYTQN